jgi:GNAT superfamily N-acetyltransferase
VLEISTDPSRLDRDLIHRFLTEESYWARWRTREQNERILDRSLCFGAYAGDGRQVGHARVVTDSVTFGYLDDVFVVPDARGRGIGKALLEAILEHPDVRDVARLTLLTADAHGLYEGFGFGPIDDLRKWMTRRRA